jgi:hypothetical protein
LKNIFGQGSSSQFPKVHAMPRVARDMDQLLAYIARQPWGDLASRRNDMYRGISQIAAHPRRNRVCIRRAASGIELRRHNIAQFAIIYAYIAPNAENPRGVVSIRAVRHRRVSNVFTGVREPHSSPGGASGVREPHSRHRGASGVREAHASYGRPPTRFPES